MRPHFVVFLNKKLISCDSIVPVVMEAHMRTGKSVMFVAPDMKSFQAIQKNLVLYDAINSIGSLVYMGRRSGGLVEMLRSRLRLLFWIAWQAIQGLTGQRVFIHFRLLEYWPYRILYLANPKRTFRFESDTFGENELMRRVGEYIRPMYKAPSVVKAYVPAGRLVAFQKRWAYLAKVPINISHYVYGASRTKKVWIDYVESRCDEYLSSIYKQTDVETDKPLLVFMLGFLGDMKQFSGGPETSVRLFNEALDILDEESHGLPVVLKPHVITDMEIVDSAIKARSRGKFVISYLHPSVLAKRAAFFICNQYTTTLADATFFGVPTIEYTDYSPEVLKITNGGSMRPEFVSIFINGDKEALRRTVVELRDAYRPNRESLKVDTTDHHVVLREMCA